jgi:hypothetical protein
MCAFSRAKTCSTRARILDLVRLAARSASERGLPLGLFALVTADPPVRFEPCLIGFGSVGGVCLDVRCGVVSRHHFAQLGAIMAGTVRDHRFADEAEATAYSDVVLVAKAGDRDIDLGPDTSLAIHGNAGFSELHRPARIHVFLRSLGRFIGPDLVGCLACFDRVLLLLRVAQLGCRHQCGIDNLSPPSLDSHWCAAGCRRHRTTL